MPNAEVKDEVSMKGTSFMNVSKKVLTFAVVGVLAAASAFAQATPPPTQPPTTAQPPATQQPPTTPPATAEKPATPAVPPKPFPEGAKIAYINVQIIASNSIEGKAASAKIQEWN